MKRKEHDQRNDQLDCGVHEGRNLFLQKTDQLVAHAQPGVEGRHRHTVGPVGQGFAEFDPDGPVDARIIDAADDADNDQTAENAGKLCEGGHVTVQEPVDRKPHQQWDQRHQCRLAERQ